MAQAREFHSRFNSPGLGLLPILLALALLVEVRAATADTPESEVSTDRLEDTTPGEAAATGLDRAALEAFADETITYLMDRHGIVGAVVAFTDAKETILAKGYGHRDRERHLPVDPDTTLFRIGSVSKLFVWTAVMQAVEQGLIDLDEDIASYVPGLSMPDTFDAPITMAHLMAHTPGFEDVVIGLFEADPDRVKTLSDGARRVPKRVLPPGHVPAYSNYGTGLAAYAVEQVFQMPFEVYVREQVFRPLGMHSSAFEQPPPEPLAADLANGYARLGGEPQGFEYVSGVAPVGSMSATASDMLRFLRAHIGKGSVGDARILEADTARRMHTQGHAVADGFAGSAHGFMERFTGGGRHLGHGGSTALFHSFAGFMPEQNLGLFVSFNTATASTATFEFLGAFEDRFFPMPTGRELATSEGSDLDAFEGVYLTERRSASDFTRLISLAMPVRVKADGDALRVRSFLTPGMEARYVPVARNLFQQEDGADRIAFLEDARGRPSRVVSEMLPVMAFGRAGGLDRPGLVAAIFFSAFAFILSALVVRPTGILAWAPRKHRPKKATRAVAAVGLGLALAYVLFVVVLVASVSGGMIAFMADTPGKKIAALIPYLGLGLTLAAGFMSIRMWRRSHFGLLARLHYTGLVFTTLALFFVLAHWKVLG